MLLLRGAAGMAWLLAVEPVIKAAASAAITRLVFIAFSLLRCRFFAKINFGERTLIRGEVQRPKLRHAGGRQPSSGRGTWHKRMVLFRIKGSRKTCGVTLRNYF